MSETSQIKESSESTAQLVYILYLASLIVGITGIVGVIMAYMNRSEAPEWLKTHYQLQIRTFWIGFLYTVISVLLMLVVIGYLMILFVLVWYIVRCVKGMKYLSKKEAYPNPTGWLF